MQEKTKLSGLTKFFFASPYFLLIFLIIPVIFIASQKLKVPVPENLLLINNGCFLACVALRLVWYVLKMRRDIRYGADYRQPTTVLALERPLPQLREEFVRAGYRFDDSGVYGEKRDLGYLGTTLVYGGLALMLLFGTYDYMRQYSIMARVGVGEPLTLENTRLAGEYEAGVLAGTSRLPLLKVTKQILPNSQWPKGATEIVLLTKDNKELTKATIAPGKPFRYGGLEYHMTKFVFDALITIRERNYIVYENMVKFFPLVQKKGVYSYYGSLEMNPVKARGDALLNPEKKAVKVEATVAGKKVVDTELELWGEHKKKQGDYETSIDGLAHWSEIRIARGRHLAMMAIGAIIGILGGIVRIGVRPQRVWFEEAEGGCRARAVGGETRRLLEGKP